MEDTADILAEHYQKTFELTYENWKERNRLFLFLVGTIGLALMLVLRVPEADSLIVDAIAKFLGITEPTRIDQLYQSFPFNVLQSLFLVVIFYLMQKLYSSNLSVLRNYQYLGALEKEIRAALGLKAGTTAFTRESAFYWDKRSVTQEMSKWYYILVIALLLLAFLGTKLFDDFSTKSYLLMLVDSLISIPTVIYFFEYTRSALKFDSPNNPKQTAKGEMKKAGK